MGGGVARGDGRKIGLLGFVTIGFFWVHGGIYGNESLLHAAPPLYLFLMLLIVPFVYSLPIALIVAELASAWPEDGGYVVWVAQACGRTVGLHHGMWVWWIYLVDAAIYPVLVAHYLDSDDRPLGAVGRGAVAMGTIALVTAINMNGVDAMVRFNTLLTVVSLAPTLIFTLWGLPRVRLAPLTASEGELHWSLMVSWVLWLYCGFFSLGTLAGELEHPRRTFLGALAILFPAVLLLNTVPLAVALAIDPDPANFSPGHFNTVAARLAGAWLGRAFQLGAIVCLVGLYNAAIVTAERSLAWIVDQGVHGGQRSSAAGGGAASSGRSSPRSAPTAALDWATPKAELISHTGLSALGGAHALRRRAHLPRACISREALSAWLCAPRSGIAPVYQIVNAALACVLAWLPYTFLVEFSMLLSVPSICLFMWAFIRLRYLAPNRARPFTVPGGNGLAVAITLIPVSISLAYAAIILGEALSSAEGGSAERREQRDEAITQVASAALVMGGSALVHALARACGALGGGDGFSALSGLSDGSRYAQHLEEPSISDAELQVIPLRAQQLSPMVPPALDSPTGVPRAALCAEPQHVAAAGSDARALRRRVHGAPAALEHAPATADSPGASRPSGASAEAERAAACAPDVTFATG
ncbi:hypothetical protein KFE25_009813 [Diacronema lutheri]|uniref:Amino acid transporter n=1 Tax=Diacronema lutheri TaxID=2081491 RepID=A0A8J5X5C6_DIALT|nr:hypothetical protein KFE25_009813 [Diacronema lutheri]